MKKKLKDSLVVLLAMLMMVAYYPLYGFAESKVIDYVDAEGSPEQCADYRIVTADTTTMDNGWYVTNPEAVPTNVESRITVSGEVNLILRNFSELHAAGGFYIQGGSSLTIWQQKPEGKSSTGYLAVATPEEGNAGIGGNNETVGGALTINGGILDIFSGDYAAAIGGGKGEGSGYESITINGGSIVAKSTNNIRNYTDGAGIGGGQGNNTLGPITINGGTVMATGTEDGAGIGGGEDRGNGPIFINGGTVIAYGGEDAAGIGGGDGGSFGEITITGGKVFAYAGNKEDDGAGIGGGATTYYGGGDGGTVRITGGSVHASGYYAFGVGYQLDPDKDKVGTVDLYNEALVSIADGGDPVKPDVREYTCTHEKEIWITPCKHEGAEYIVTKQSHKMICEHCLAVKNGAQDHQWNEDYTVDKEATYTQTGVKSKHCSVCDAVDAISMVTIPKKQKVDLPRIAILKPAAATKAATVKWKKVGAANLKRIAKIQIQYSTDKNFKKGVKTVTAKKTAVSKKITKLASKKRYYFRIRSYRLYKGVTHVSKWSAVRYVRVK